VDIAQLINLAANVGVSIIYSLVLLKWVTGEITKILRDITENLKEIKKELSDQRQDIEQLQRMIYIKGDGKHELFP